MNERQSITGDQIDRAIDQAEKTLSVVDRVSSWFSWIFKKKNRK